MRERDEFKADGARLSEKADKKKERQQSVFRTAAAGRFLTVNDNGRKIDLDSYSPAVVTSRLFLRTDNCDNHKYSKYIAVDHPWNDRNTAYAHNAGCNQQLGTVRNNTLHYA